MKQDSTEKKKKKSKLFWVIVIAIEVLWIPLAFYWDDIVHTAFLFDFPVAMESAKKQPEKHAELKEPINQVLRNIRDIHIAEKKGTVSIDLFFSLMSGQNTSRVGDYLKKRKTFTIEPKGDTDGNIMNAYKAKEFVIKHKGEDVTIKVPKEIKGTYKIEGNHSAPKVTLQLQPGNSIQGCVTKLWFISACITLEAIVMTPNSVTFDFDRDSYNATYTY